MFRLRRSVLLPRALRGSPRRRWLAVAPLSGPLAVLYSSVGPVAVLGSLMMLVTEPLDPGIAVVAGLSVAVGLLQCLTAAASCPAPSR